MTDTKNSQSFYADIAPFADFSRVADPVNYSPAPDDWFVVIADIQGSTKAIEQGRYKQVNMIGAACINAVLNVCEQGEIPYVFGGDGATLLIPAQRIDAVKHVLCAVRRLAESRFDLSLRVGVVGVAEIHRGGKHSVRVAKYQISPGNMLAAFSGGGVELAEQWIKSDPGYLVDDDGEKEPPDLSGLSCRWEPLGAQSGVMLSLLIQVTTDDEQRRADIYTEMIAAIAQLSGDSGKPVCAANMHFRWPPRGLQMEIDLTVGLQNRTLWAVRIYLNSLLQWALDKFNLTAGGYRGRQYRVELRNNTDYRRFDDTLRMLLDCSSEQADRIEALLAQRAQTGELKFGTHRSDSALMTCLVFDLQQSQHMHFVDGSDGGFTSAAKQMKSFAKVL